MWSVIISLGDPKNTSNAVPSEYFYVGVKVSISAFKFILNVKQFKDFKAEKTNLWKLPSTWMIILSLDVKITFALNDQQNEAKVIFGN